MYMEGYYRALKWIIFFWGVVIITACYPTVTNNVGDKTSPMAGEWIIEKQSVSPVSIAQRCKLIQKGSVFKFTENTLEIYADPTASPCGIYRFMIKNNTISFIREDMLWLCMFEIDAETLTLKSNSFFVSEETPAPGPSGMRQEIVISLSKK
jgi:hypothetical protein